MRDVGAFGGDGWRGFIWGVRVEHTKTQGGVYRSGGKTRRPETAFFWVQFFVVLLSLSPEKINDTGTKRGTYSIPEALLAAVAADRTTTTEMIPGASQLAQCVDTHSLEERARVLTERFVTLESE